MAKKSGTNSRNLMILRCRKTRPTFVQPIENAKNLHTFRVRHAPQKAAEIRQFFKGGTGLRIWWDNFCSRLDPLRHGLDQCQALFREPHAVGRVSINLDLAQRLVAGHSSDLVSGGAGLGQPPRCSFAQPVWR